MISKVSYNPKCTQIKKDHIRVWKIRVKFIMKEAEDTHACYLSCTKRVKYNRMKVVYFLTVEYTY